MGRPEKDDAERYIPLRITLPPDVKQALDALMRADGEDNRSRMVSDLILAEQARRARSRARKERR